MISEWIGRISELEEDKEDLLLDEAELVKDISSEDDSLRLIFLIGRSSQSNIVRLLGVTDNRHVYKPVL